ncbi:MAG: tetratricopeptide repeat protein [Bacillota bacterium]
MKFHSSVTIFLSLLLILTFTITIEAQNRLEDGKELFLTARSNFYNNQQDFSTTITTLEESQNYFSQTQNDFSKFYWQAQSEFVIAEIYESKEKQRKAAQSFTRSETLIKKALRKKETSDALRLLADCYMRQMNYKGQLYKMTHGSKSLQLLKQSIELDSANYTAYNSLGTYYINAPKIGGGDINQGIKMLKKALASTNQFDNFITYQWLGIAYNKQNNTEQAVNHINHALEIYPNSSWGQNKLEEFRNGAD